MKKKEARSSFGATINNNTNQHQHHQTAPQDKFKWVVPSFRVPRIIGTGTDTGEKGKKKKKKQKEAERNGGGGGCFTALVQGFYSDPRLGGSVPSLPSPAFSFSCAIIQYAPLPLVRIWFAAGWLPTPSSTNSE